MSTSQDDIQPRMVVVARFIQPGEWMTYGDMAQAVGLSRNYARAVANANVDPLWRDGIDIPLRKTDGSNTWHSRDWAMPHAERVMEDVTALHEAAGLPRDRWPQHRRVAPETIHARMRKGYSS